MNEGKIENVLGAFLLALSDSMIREMESHAPEPGPAVSALALLGDAPGMSIEKLRRILGLSHPGAVRLVDRLSAEGLVRRQPSKNDRRAVEVHLTDVGRKSSAAILCARRRRMAAALQHLEPIERVAFGELTEKMLVQFIKGIEDACSICRLCDHNACTDCPVNQALFSEDGTPTANTAAER